MIKRTFAVVLTLPVGVWGVAIGAKVLSRDQLLGLSRLHNDEVYDRSIDVQVGRLRKKVQPG